MEGKLKVVVLCTNADEAGAPRHVEAIIRGLSNEFSFFAIFGESGPVERRMCELGIYVDVIPEIRSSISPFKDLAALYKLLQILKKINPDIVHCHSTKAGMLGRIAANILGIRSIYTVHGWGWRGMSAFQASIIRWIEKLMALFTRCQYIYVSSDVESIGLTEVGIGNNRGKVIHNGVFVPNNIYFAHDGPLTILMPARVDNAKDHETLVRAFEELPISNVKLVLCGCGTDRPSFRIAMKKIAKTKFQQIEFKGQVSDMSILYSKSHVVALISRYEALPLSIIEAMGYSKGIIATRVGGVPELIRDNIDGLLVGVGDVQHLKAAFMKMLSSGLRSSLGTSARQRFLLSYTSEKMNSNIRDFYIKKNFAK